MCKKMDCFANRDGKCMALSETRFIKRECPFYRTDISFDEQMKEAWAYTGKKDGKEWRKSTRKMTNFVDM